MLKKDNQKRYQKMLTKLVKTRQKRNITQLAIAVITGWSTEFVQDFENKEIFITPKELNIYAEAVGKKVHIK